MRRGMWVTGLATLLFLDVVIFGAVRAGSAAADPPSQPGEASKSVALDGKTRSKGVGRALLIGCTVYDHLPRTDHLQGPANDVKLLQEVLVGEYRFDPANIIALAEDSPDGRPTRANIAHSFESLTSVTQPGDRVVIFLAGHGTRQPAVEKDGNFEPDGFDEVFLPADCDKWSRRHRSIQNAVVDNDLGEWLEPLTSKPASVLVVVDACHSGGMVRGTGGDRVRQIPTERLVPADVIREAQGVAEADTQRVKSSTAFRAPPEAPDLVAIYAAPSSQLAIESSVLPGAADQCHGAFTYALAHALTQAARAESPLTNRELARRIADLYTSWALYYPNPLIEGKGIDRFVLADKPESERLQYRVSYDEKASSWFVNAGELHGLTPLSVLAISPPAGTTKSDRPVGFVKIPEYGCEILKSRVEPITHQDQPPPQLAEGMRAKAVYLDLAVRQRTLAIDPLTDEIDAEGVPRRVPPAHMQRLEQTLAPMREGQRYVQLIDDPAAADWLVRLRKAGGEEFVLAPRSGYALEDGEKEGPRLFGPAPVGPEMAAWVDERLRRVVRAETLLRLAGTIEMSPGFGQEDFKIKLETIRLSDDSEKTGQPVEWEKDGPRFKAGQRLGFRLTNQGRVPAYVTLLFIDSAFGIDVFFPRSFGVDNLLEPKKSMQLLATVNAETVGREHLVLFAVQAKERDAPADFGFLAQPRLEAARSVGAKRGGPQTIDSPLGLLFQNALFSAGTTRGLSISDGAEAATQVLTWTVEP